MGRSKDEWRDLIEARLRSAGMWQHVSGMTVAQGEAPTIFLIENAPTAVEDVLQDLLADGLEVTRDRLEFDWLMDE